MFNLTRIEQQDLHIQFNKIYCVLDHGIMTFLASESEFFDHLVIS